MKGIHFLDKLANHLLAGREKEAEAISRRLWLQNFGLISASSAVLWACGGDKDDDKATADDSDLDPAADAAIVKVALGLEQEAIGLYTAAAGVEDIWEENDTTEAVLAIATAFLAHHKTHLAVLNSGLADLQKLDSSIEDMAAAKTATEYAEAAVEAGADLTSVGGILRLASGKEGAAAKAYGSVALDFTNPDLAKFSIEHAGDEAAHYGVLRAALFAVLGDTDFIADATKVVPSAVLSGFTTAIKA